MYIIMLWAGTTIPPSTATCMNSKNGPSTEPTQMLQRVSAYNLANCPK